MVINTTTTVTDRRKEVAAKIDALIKRDVLVGVSRDTAYDGVSPGGVNNAVKAYLNDNGAPEVNIPQREFMRPGILAAKAEIVKHLKAAGQAVLRGDLRGVKQGMSRAGLAAQLSVREEITSGPLAPTGRQLSPRTLANRRAEGFDGTEPLFETGALRQSITYVLDDADANP